MHYITMLNEGFLEKQSGRKSRQSDMTITLIQIITLSQDILISTELEQEIPWVRLTPMLFPSR